MTSIAQPAEQPPLNVVSRFLGHVQAQPQASAVVHGDRTLSYRQLAERSAALAAELRGGYSLPGEPPPIAAVLLPRGLEAVVAAVAVQRAGFAHLPLEPKEPDDRLRRIVQDARPACLISDEDGGKLASQWGPPIVRADAHPTVTSRNEGSGRLPAPGEQEWAAVIYTSGTTGTPRGVVVLHEGLANLVSAHVQHFGTGPGDRCAWASDVGFDAAMWDIWSILGAGAALHVADDAVRLDPARLTGWLAQHAITSMFLVTPLASALMRGDDPPASLRMLLTGGDRLWNVPCRGRAWPVYNAYGPTESTVAVTWTAELDPTDMPPSVGCPLPGVTITVLGRDGQPLPAGEQGEVAVSGRSLALGYLRDQKRTAECWVPDPSGDGSRMYLTGDLGWLGTDGELRLAGRNDQQVKVRGIRIDLGEIVSAALALDGVSAAVAVPVGEPASVAIGLLWTAEPSGPGSQALLEHLRRRLPAAAVPTRLLRVDALPLTVRGKTDSAAAARLLMNADTAADGVAASHSDSLERLVAEIFAEVTEGELPGPEDSFFSIGGTSLLAVRAIARLRAYAPGFSLVRFYREPTVREVAASLRSYGLEETMATGRPEAPSGGSVPPG